MGKSSGKEKTPRIEADNVESRQRLSLIDVISEGQIEGVVRGLKDVYLNKTPIQAEDGSYNFKGVDIEWTTGTQSQLPLSGFSETQNEIPVNLEVKKDTPIVRTITDPYVDRVRVTVGVSALYSQTTSGDMLRTSVSMVIQVWTGGVWVTKKTVDLIDKKTRTQYLTSVILEDLPQAPFNIRVLRLTPDSRSDLLVNKTIWSSYTEIYDLKLSYPNTALVGLRFDSSQFSGIPSRNYLIRGIRCKIPVNYDPILRKYNGIWLGEFKTEWTNNPAWIVYDLITNNRYGVARRFKRLKIDKFVMYSIAQYCDELVDDGFGGEEPRFTCNCYITERVQAYDLINKFFSIFRAMPVWDGMQLSAVIDRPCDPVAIYTNANVINGIFSYSSSAMKDRHTAIRVKYIDPNYGWEPIVEYVADDDAKARFGINELDIEAFGCTSRGQAHRVGKWIIATEKYEKQAIMFSVGLDGLKHLPGDVIEILDNKYASVEAGGRIVKVDGNVVTLDRDIKIDENAYLTYQDINAKMLKIKIKSQISPNTLILEHDIKIDQWSTWLLTHTNVSSKLYRAMTITESDDNTYEIAAIEHEPKKELYVDKGAVFVPDKNKSISWRIPAIESLSVSVTPDSNEYQAILSWSVPRTINNLKFQVILLRNGNFVSRQVVSEMSAIINNIDEGKYQVSVRGITEEERLGDEATVTFTIASPETPSQLVFASTSNTVTIKPIMSSNIGLGTTFEYYKGSTLDELLSMQNYLGRTTNKLIDADVQASTTYFYGVVAVNAAGRSGMCTGSATTTDDTVGTAGGIFRIKTTDGIFPVINDKATELFHDVLGMYPSRDTVMIIYAEDEEGKITKTEAKMYDGTEWVAPSLFLDGGLIAQGTISGDRLVAYTEIKAPIIRGGSININNRFIVDENGHLTVTASDDAGKFTLRKNCMEFYDETGFKVARLGVWK